MKRLFLFMAFVVLWAASPARAETWADTWANWEMRLNRAFDGITPRKVPGRAMGILVPAETRHDLYPMAAFGYELLIRDNFRTVVYFLSAPPNYPGTGLVIPDVEALETPMGRFTIDNVLGASFQNTGYGVTVDNSLFSPNVSGLLETQLALLKFALSGKTANVKILPMYVNFSDVNSESKDLAPMIAETLKDIGRDGNVAFVMVGNLTRAASESQLIKTDSSWLSALRSLDVDGIMSIQNGAVETPDLAPLVMGTLTLRWLGADHAEVLAYAHSGQLILTKDKRTPIGYVTAGFSSAPPLPPRVPHVNREKMVKIFNELFRSDLLTMTRQACASILSPTAAKPPALINREAGKKWPVYVSLYDADGRVLGQAGSHTPVGPLEESLRQFSFEVIQQAKPVMKTEEFPKTVVEISIPYGFNAIDQPEELIPILNGVIVKSDGKTTAFHPDAWRVFPDPHQLLGALCHRLGAKPWAYATREADVESFRTLSFNEKEPFQDLGTTTKKKKKKEGEEEELPATGGGDLFSF